MTADTACIVVATDFSDCSDNAQRRAVQLAGLLGCRLKLVHAVEVAPLIPAWGDPGGGAWVTEEQLLEGARAHLESERQAVATSSGLQVDAELLIGSPHREISRHAEALQATLVVVGSHGRRGLIERLLGSTAHNVVRHSSHAVLAVRLPSTQPYGKVLAATDFSAAADAALDLGWRLASDAQWRLLHVHEPPGEHVLAYARVDAELQRRYKHDMQQRAAADLERTAARLGRGIATDLAHGHPVKALMASIESWKPQLLVLGAHGKNALEAGLLGSVSQHAVQHAECDVLVARAT